MVAELEGLWVGKLGAAVRFLHYVCTLLFAPWCSTVAVVAELVEIEL